MLTLQFELEFQKINLVNRWETVATDSKNYLVASFSTISDDWTTPITAIFTNDKDEQPYAVVVGADSTLESNECYVPWEVLKDESNVYVSAYCGNLHTTVTAQFHVYKSGYADGETPPPPSPTVYDAIMEAITNLQNGKQDKLTAGENITISSDNVISAEGGLSDYTDLENKPSINNVTLSGNKSSDDLSLQGKLTAGNNITINNGVISASGGVTSYNDLTDKPYLRINNSTGTLPPWEIKKELSFKSHDFYGQFLEGGETIAISLDGKVCKFHPEPLSYDFNWISSAPYNGCLVLNHRFVSNFPSALNKLDTSKPYFVSQFFNPSEFGNAERYLLRKVYGYSINGGFVEYAQICYIYYQYYTENQIISQTDWVELTGGGSQIVSGVVNANGTITFTDSDGNTFTTTGSSVIGPQGDDYVLTAQDKSDIADIVLSELPTTQGVLYGNTSN